MLNDEDDATTSPSAVRLIHPTDDRPRERHAGATAVRSDGVRLGWKIVDHPDANGGGRTDYGEPTQSLIVTAHLPEDYEPRDLMRESLHDLGRYSLLAVPASKGIKIGAAGAGALWRAALEGRELKVGNNVRIAPFGNRTPHPLGQWPHYHRRGVGPNGKTRDGQGMGRHRPWEKKSTDDDWWDRF